jgi:hypothetical protein
MTNSVLSLLSTIQRTNQSPLSFMTNLESEMQCLNDIKGTEINKILLSFKLNYVQPKKNTENTKHFFTIKRKNEEPEE